MKESPITRQSGLVSPARLFVETDGLAQTRQGIIGKAPHVFAVRLMAEHEPVGLGAVDESEGYPGVRSVKERSLSLYQIPVVRLVFRRQALDGPGDEIGDDRVDADSLTGDEDPGLPGSTKIGLHAPGSHLFLHTQGGEHLAAGDIRTDGEQTPTRAPAAVAQGKGAGRMADVDESAALVLCSAAQFVDVIESVVEATGDVVTQIHGCQQRLSPLGRDHTTPIGDADDQGASTRIHPILQAFVGQAHVSLTSGQPQLTHTPISSPARDTVRRLGG